MSVWPNLPILFIVKHTTLHQEVKMRRGLCLVVLLFVVAFSASNVSFDNNWGKNPLFNLVSESPAGVEVIFSVHKVVVEEQMIDGILMKHFSVPGIFLPNDEGAPNLAGTGRYIAIPQGGQARVTVLDSRTEVYHNVEIAPAPHIPFENDNSPLRYKKDIRIYGRNAYYPEIPVKLSEPFKMRGVDVVILGITPFQYNPVTKDLIIYKDIRVRVDFIGGNGHFGEDRLRSRFWEPILQGHLLNYNSLQKIDFYNLPNDSIGRFAGYEYIIIVPDDAAFMAWGDTIKNWRKLQGITSEVFTLTEIGGSDSSSIKNFLQNAYYNWNVAPVAFLLLGDYEWITSPHLSYVGRLPESYVSDNWYADVHHDAYFNYDTLPELHHGRICAQNEEHLRIMIHKFLSYERNPPTAANFYNEPLIAVAWQSTAPNPPHDTDCWFQISGEVIRNFFINNLGKNPQRQYAIYEGNPYPDCPWSGAPNTHTVAHYWYDVGWLPDTINPHDSTWWDNGSTPGIITAINSGAFLVQHRDHGEDTGWALPPFHNNDLDNLTNTMFPFVFSTNCLTGRYDSLNECFVEKFHRIPHGAVGLNAASGVSFPFVNDAYIWGCYDGLWQQFDPNYGPSEQIGYQSLMPCMAMTYGKYYLNASSWPSNAEYKSATYGLYHHHGDVFTPLYSEIPRHLSVIHQMNVSFGQTHFGMRANSGSIIALTVNGEIIGLAEATGAVQYIEINPQNSAGTMIITVTKPNYFRHQSSVHIGPVLLEPRSICSDGEEQVSFLDIYPTACCSHLNIIFSVGNGQSEFSLRIYDATGRFVKEFKNLNVQSSHKIIWHGDDDYGQKVCSGVYFVKLESDDFTAVKKAILLE
jgi:hypothetical protein